MYSYYSYLSKFHVEPVSWRDLFEYMEYNNIENEVTKTVAELSNNK
jgi:hypothetical protein